ncbi:uncharacterized protein si:dkey-10c21.1 isoform X2 [Thunnus maccoyii]|uniref:uncharacterized protein si:dkey-10c21.1 isoform X2 n=1 Tax=Thunnus maccoyii TaxID=8240 RepID=UPI001C4C2125|nr:uncharacterized protein si:dkey-10c21.1 isoform X2 [Thunnus maccoyii]XP_042281375.1 uncharacterized protein si:dkey-10c21.1 isoform X2 [Thunnus maccoyii]
MDKLKSEEDKLGSATPTQSADDSSVVTAREITNTKAKSINMKIETVSQPGSRASGNVVGQFPKADLVAQRNSVICADKITNVNIDGDIDMSVSVKPPKACAGAGASSQSEDWERGEISSSAPSEGTVDETMSSYMDLR